MKVSFEPQQIDLDQLKGYRRILIDGDPGSGKSTLAKKMSEGLDGKVISLDDYLLQDGRPYIEQLRCHDLKQDILATANPIVIVEGVCALQVLKIIKVAHDFHIWLKLEMQGRWEMGEYLSPGVKPPKSKLSREVVEYYRKFRPHEVCNLAGTLSIEIG